MNESPQQRKENNRIKDVITLLYAKLHIWVNELNEFSTKNSDIKKNITTPKYKTQVVTKNGQRLDYDFEQNPQLFANKLRRNISSSELALIKENINVAIEELWALSKEADYYWHNCPLKTYKLFFKEFKSQFKNEIDSDNSILFLEKELSYFMNSNNKEVNFNHVTEHPDYFLDIDYYIHLSQKNKTKIEVINNSKIEFIKSEIEKEKSNAETKTKRSTSFFDKHVTIFKDNESAELFRYLDENHIDNFERAKYIDIYRYLTEDSHRIICTQNMYIEFIEQTKNLIISKITPETYKYKTKTRTILKNLNKLHLKNIEILNEE